MTRIDVFYLVFTDISLVNMLFIEVLKHENKVLNIDLSEVSFITKLLQANKNNSQTTCVKKYRLGRGPRKKDDSS